MLQPLYKHTCINVNNYSCLTAKNLSNTLASMSIGKRLKRARQLAELTQAQLAEKLKGIMTQQNISLLESETTTGTEYIVQLAVACGVSAEWLAMGTGEMYNVNKIYDNTPEAMALKAMQHMDAATKYQAVKILDTLAEPPAKDNGTDKK